MPVTMNDGKVHGLEAVSRKRGLITATNQESFLFVANSERGIHMFETKLKNLLQTPPSFDAQTAAACRDRVDQLIKPRGSLGVLEDLAVQLAGIQGKLYPEVNQKAVLVMAGDHDIIEEGVATSKKDITTIQAVNMTRGLTGVCALARPAGAEVFVYDVAINEDVSQTAIIPKKVRWGTGNFYRAEAMSREEAAQCLWVGIEAALEAKTKGFDLLAIGEMGIGNTTPSAAITAVITHSPASLTTGMGANLPPEQVSHKASIIQAAIDRHLPDPEDCLDILHKVGGCEIGAMAGVMVGGARYGIPVIVDGYIAWAAALLAETLYPGTKQFLIASHKSMEAGAQIAAAFLGMKPYLDLEMRLGEGTGAVMMFHVVASALAMNRHMITFDEANFRVK